MKDTDIIVVSGLPRSGTSLMMQMLAAGGLPVLTDGKRAADIDNPAGYYEYEPALQADHSWLAEAGGKAVKVISTGLPGLPASYAYRVIFMRRDMREVLISQRLLALRAGLALEPEAHALAVAERQHLVQTLRWLVVQPHMAALLVDYNALIAQPAPAVERVNVFLGGKLDTTKMAAAVRPELYRNRAGVKNG